MNSSIGLAFVWGALLCSVFGGVVGIASGMTRREGGYVWAYRAVWGMFACMLLANLTMEYALLTHDFSVKYVAQVGSKSTPTLFTIVSLWSALEGSILFWGVIMGVYVLAFSVSMRREDPRFMALAQGTMLLVAAFFAFAIAGPANPFIAVPNPPLDGPGPNPLLQNHILMVIHPPFLYLGYVGMVVPFGVAVAALLHGELRTAWMAPLRRWTLIPWTGLSIGIILGAWWAYAVLGWGGYWAWDPVENASLLPWLTATAFIHSTMVQERKGTLKAWTVVLALVTFLLTILGTFMTRSGVFNSVHSFTQSDIGPLFFWFLVVLFFGCIVLVALRSHLLVPEGELETVSRETSILVNNLAFVALTFTVLIGTTYPLISEAIRGEKVSVGEPYFNKVAVPFGLLVLFLMGVGPMLPWGRATPDRLKKQALIPGAVGLVTFALCFAFGLRGFAPLLTFGLAGFVTAITLRELFLPAVVRMKEKKENFFNALVESALKSRRRFGGYVVHLGVIVLFVAVAASSSFVTHSVGTLAVGQELTLGNYRLRYNGPRRGQEPHRAFFAAEGTVLSKDGKTLAEIAPRFNYYEMSNDPIGTPAVVESIGEDFYVSLTAYDEGRNTASFNVWVFPLVGWIWYAGIPLMAMGALIAAWPSFKRGKLKVPGTPSLDAAGSSNAQGAA